MSASTDSDCGSGSKSCTFTCPAGGTWYVCPDEPYFVGCCSSDPCSNTNSNNTSPCPNIHPASFDTAIYDSLVPNNCIDTTSDNWYTCTGTDQPFIGCCASNACAETTGCPEDDVRAAAWSSSRDDQFTLFQDADPNDDNGGGDDGLGGGAIAGIVVGAVAAVVIVIALVWWFLRRRKMQRQDTLTGKSSGNQYPPSPYQDSHFSSPGPTAVGTNAGYLSVSGVSSNPSSPPLPSESGRVISELYSNNGDEQHLYNQGSGQHGLGVFGANPQIMPELDNTSKPAQVHELDGGDRR
ncbi:uncharacterized protein APUU_12356A [Aspergillus puulaauensis]|uniref:Uncharacterized protein n=1 Tax=Aspergillus puulaauensis TaxID=1220207 RepID=A0A7R7XE12_9EURO|nr:uncharacterized protein APUU_12356A [Aspergillus puulaauensis]BCS19528.1 hypothetical protein APUU_12356A [Aspergillus puulaauensis]